jgi:signal transduction histidine kinase
MTKDECDRLFTPYESQKDGGMGVGMVTAKQVVEETHRGELVVTSKKGDGTRIVMRLPAKRVRA